MSDTNKPFKGAGFWIELHFADGYVKAFCEDAPERGVYGAYDKLEAYEASGQGATDTEEHGKVVKTISVSSCLSVSRDGVEIE